MLSLFLDVIIYFWSYYLILDLSILQFSTASGLVVSVVAVIISEILLQTLYYCLSFIIALFQLFSLFILSQLFYFSSYIFISFIYLLSPFPLIIILFYLFLLYNSFNLLIILPYGLIMALAYILFYFYGILFHLLWIRDLNREIAGSGFSQSPNTNSPLFYAILIMLLSEWILFLSLFLSYFHFILSFIILPLESIILCYLSYYGTIILSFASIFGGYLLSILYILYFENNLYFILLFIAYFIIYQYSEFRFLGLSFEDCILGSLFFYLLSLHLFHIILLSLFILFLELYFIPFIYYSQIIFGIYSIYSLLSIITIFILFSAYFVFSFFRITAARSNYRIPPRWIEIATGNLVFWLSYFGIYFIYFIYFSAFLSILLYCHFVELLWLGIDFFIYFL
jgi:heme/copper-type cytochrome/quinol oxidase subunit 3